jgi:hypothetical protein
VSLRGFLLDDLADFSVARWRSKNIDPKVRVDRTWIFGIRCAQILCCDLLEKLFETLKIALTLTITLMGGAQLAFRPKSRCG